MLWWRINEWFGWKTNGCDHTMNGNESFVGEENRFDEVREAAGAVLASLKRLLEATERVVDDPEAMAAVTTAGRSFVDSFTKGFRFSDDRDGREPTAEDQ